MTNQLKTLNEYLPSQKYNSENLELKPVYGSREWLYEICPDIYDSDSDIYDSDSDIYDSDSDIDDLDDTDIYNLDIDHLDNKRKRYAVDFSQTKRPKKYKNPLKIFRGFLYFVLYEN